MKEQYLCLTDIVAIELVSGANSQQLQRADFTPTFLELKEMQNVIAAHELCIGGVCLKTKFLSGLRLKVLQDASLARTAL